MFSRFVFVGNRAWKLLSLSLRSSPAEHLSSPANVKNITVRLMSGGHKRTIELKPTNFEWRVFKDQLHFYVLLGLIPIGIIISAANLFIGQAELADIPEGHEPKHWEYYRSPFSRFIARYILDSPEEVYERNLHFLNIEQDKLRMRKLQKKIDLLIGDAEHRHDSRRWYYVPANERTALVNKADKEDADQYNDSIS